MIASSNHRGTAIQARFLLEYPASKDNGFILDVNLDIPGSGITAIFGASGSGKTSLLRCIAGLQKAQQGQLQVAGVTWQDHALFLPPHKRPLGYVFQEASLLPHLSVAGNLRYAIKRADKGKPVASFDQIVALLDIEQLLKQHPQQLSGGERQRVAIARALLVNPRLLLMDEPLASLDAPRKREILPYLEKLHAELQIPLLYVSHAADEVARLADHLVVLDKGRALDNGPITEVLSRLDLPMQLGEDAGGVIEAQVIERDSQWQLAQVAFPGGRLWLRDTGEQVGETVRVRILARDISLALSPHGDSSILNILSAEVDEVSLDESGALCMVRLKLDGAALVARITRRSADYLKLVSGMRVWAQIKSAAVVR